MRITSPQADVSHRYGDRAGVVTVLKEARAAHVIKLATIKYMVMYQLLLSLALNMCALQDGSQFNLRQVRLDLAQALLCCMPKSAGCNGVAFPGKH